MARLYPAPAWTHQRSGGRAFAIARFESTGRLDDSSRTAVGGPSRANSLATDSEGRIVMGGIGTRTHPSAPFRHIEFAPPFLRSAASRRAPLMMAAAHHNLGFCPSLASAVGVWAGSLRRSTACVVSDGSHRSN